MRNRDFEWDERPSMSKKPISNADEPAGFADDGGIDWVASDAMSDADIAVAVAGDPDAAPVDDIPSPNARRVCLARVLRRRLGLTHAEFEARYRVPINTLFGWERGTAIPDTMAEAFLKLIAADPDGVAAKIADTGMPVAAE
jgi:putative transcriptional regulator